MTEVPVRTTPQDAPSLFRAESRYPSGASQLGTILLSNPLSLGISTTVATVLAATLILFLIFGSYTKRSTASGQLVPDSGVLKVYAPELAIIVEKHVTEGGHVERGETLYVLSTERRSSLMGNTQAAIAEQVKQRIGYFHDELDQLRIVARQEQSAAAHKANLLSEELEKLTKAAEQQERRLTLAHESTLDQRHLLELGYVSKDQARNYEMDLLDQNGRLDSLQSDALSTRRNLDEQRSIAATSTSKSQAHIAEVERALSSAQEDLALSEARRQLVISAPTEGMTTTIIGEVGQNVDVTRPLLSIVPTGSTLQANLYVSGSAIGFVREGQDVLLRYSAFPYQKFGHQKGVILSVAKTAAVTAEFTGYSVSAPGGGDPVYRVIVGIKSQTINAYGKPQKLQAGMLVSAEIMQDKRRLYEWILEPLYTLTGRL